MGDTLRLPKTIQGFFRINSELIFHRFYNDGHDAYSRALFRKNKMTIYYYGIDYNIGGLEIFGKNLITYVRKHCPDISVVILAAYPQIAFQDYFLQLGCTIVRLPLKNKKPLAYYKALIEALSQHEEGDILQINACSYRNYLLFKAAKRSGIKTIIVGHASSSDNLFETIVHRIFQRRFARLGEKIAVSDSAKTFMFGRECNNARTIVNGIDFERFSFSSKKRKEMRERLGVSDKELLIAHVGRISKLKNQLFSLEVMKLFIDQNPKARCFFFGDENDKDMGNTLRLSQSERISLCPPDAENVDAIYCASDILLVPSLAEGLSLVVLESIRSGCQVFINESLGKLDGVLPNVHYLPLETKAWVSELGKVDSSMLVARATIDLPEIYSLERSMSEYLKTYAGLTPSENTHRLNRPE